jgi:solute carrier family 13 (sodium-dependent dicarboxylate transporter), member 2/3/5
MQSDPSPPQVSDERREIRGITERLEVRSWLQGIQTLVCTAIAWSVSFLPLHEGLSDEGRRALFILLLAAGLWVTEAVAAYGVALLIVALEILLLGQLGRGDDEWARFLAPWASPLLWLFLGGFVLGKAATKTGLDRWLARRVLQMSGTTPERALLGLMVVGFGLSMFMSNTAAAAMLVAVAGPIGAARPAGDPTRKALLLGVAVATNLGGMGTLIGSPPNAIAAGALGGLESFSFTRWMLVGLPPAIALFALAYLWLVLRYRPVDTSRAPLPDATMDGQLPIWRRLIALGVIGATLVLWMTGELHGVPTPVVSFLPISAFAATGILRPKDIRELPWDVLLLLFGGLALGLAVSETGLATWLVGSLPVGELGLLALALAAAYATVVLSNFMSNTAAATILIPLGIALAHGSEGLVAVPIALAASAAMCLPISTPPNAIAFASGELEGKDFLVIGLLMMVIAPAVVVAWCALAMG